MKQKGIDNFAGQRVWVIGASSGIGEACAKSLLQQGAKVALSSRRVGRLNAIAEQSDINQAIVIALDVTIEEQLREGYEKIQDAWGGIDLLLFVSDRKSTRLNSSH